jgi:SAM-dependent methyltransferase
VTVEAATCACCGGTGTHVVREAADYLFAPDVRHRYVRCGTCGLVYLNPRPRRDEMARHYPPAYFALYPEVMRNGERSPLMRLGFTLIRRRRLPARPPGRALDIGCGSGFYLATLRRLGWVVDGVEISEDAARHARELNDIAVRVGSAEMILPDLPDRSFDLVTMWHVLEHLHDPRAVLSQVARVLRPDGLLMLEVPNFAGACSRVFRSSWAPLEPPRHLFQFTPASLSALLGGAGLRVARLRGIASPQNLCASVRLSLERTAGRPSTIASVYFSPPWLMAAAYPVEWLLTHARLSGELSAVARPAG